ncbi:hypothetical protein MESS2_350087 [Mesorhizobium metallidurans STM 2683]|uniref:Uncharacterized protein n=1 Tax=Mesorhizobium metallidurans STM 2683 TaxID=1297569 RepID=M5ERL9_9HYPH|nr:hypothetical protein MESS2_350087 [Mesorhizobium metallidurans STM 2683]
MAFIALMSLLIWQDISNHIERATAEIYKGCSENNAAVAAMPTDQQHPYCSCMSDKMAPKVVWKTAVAFATQQPLSADPRNDPDFMAKITQVSTDCAAAIGAK